MGKSAVSPYRETVRLTCLLCHESTLARTRVECRRVAQAGFIPAASRIAAHRKKHSAGTGGATVIACYQDMSWAAPLRWDRDVTSFTKAWSSSSVTTRGQSSGWDRICIGPVLTVMTVAYGYDTLSRVTHTCCRQ